ncbi:hypothetical protein MNBD_DELTA01-949 [hydrothermal vent metagenome]|uniref:Thermostable hemolysin delta-VPH n=1 Tax=hydrothermal vent metagenome TaxID=652676 RepID=A0A3B0RJT1_9ZZZZ
MHIESPEKLDLLLIDKSAARRSEVEEFSKNIYRRFYSAELTTFPDELLAITYGTKEIISCIGITSAAISPLYLEQYIGGPIEREIAAITRRSVEREEIVEIGTLAIRSKSTCRMIISALAGVLVKRKKKFLVFTAVKTLRNTLTNLEVPFTTLARARATQVKDSSKWGSYYNASPEVIMIDIESCRVALRELMNNASTAVPLARAAQAKIKMRRAMKQLFIKGLTLEKAFTEESFKKVEGF